MAKRKRISYATIAACKMGNEDALKEILQHYQPMIIEAATRTVSNADGTTYKYVDEDIKAYIESELAMKILVKYDLTRKPPQKPSSASHTDNEESTT